MTHPRSASSTSRRRLLGGAMAIAGGAMLPALSGCGAQSGGTRVGSGDRALRQWYHQYGEQGTQEAVIRYATRFVEEHPGVSVDVGWNPGDYTSKLSTSLLRGGPDVYEFGQPTLDMVRNGQIEPLDDLYTDQVAEDFNPIVLDRIRIGGKLYAIPIVLDTSVLYYRKSMLSRAGVEPPETIDELIAATRRLSRGNAKGLFLGNDGGVGATWNLLPWSAGVAFMTGTKLSFNNDSTAAAYEKLVELNDTGGLLMGYTTDYIDPSAFIQGACAMQWSGLWAMPAIEAELGDDFGVVPWPKMTGVDGATYATIVGGWQQMVNPQSPHLEDAKQLAKWMWLDQQDIQRDFNLAYGFHIPPRNSTAAEAEELASGPAADAASFLEQYGNVMPNSWTEAMNTYLIDGVGRMLKRGADIAAELDEIEQKCQRELDNQLS